MTVLSVCLFVKSKKVLVVNVFLLHVQQVTLQREILGRPQCTTEQCVRTLLYYRTTTETVDTAAVRCTPQPAYATTLLRTVVNGTLQNEVLW